MSSQVEAVESVEIQKNERTFKKRGRPRTWLNEDEAVERWRLLIERPPQCVCGYQTYRYKLHEGLLRSRCNTCDEAYIYDAFTDRWVPSKFSVRRGFRRT